VSIDFLHMPARSRDGNIHVVVETPRGSRAKFKFDTENRTFAMSRPLSLGLHYPFDWGFVPSTQAEDGDPLDALVIHDAVSYPGMVIRCRPVAILEVEQTEAGATKRNDRLMFAPAASRRQESLDDLRALSPEMRGELERFFLAAVAGTGKQLRFVGWNGRSAAMAAIDESARRFSVQLR